MANKHKNQILKIIKIRTKVNIKIKLNQILNGEIEKKNQNKMYSNQKFENQICYNQQII
jgi:hypothetical protein